MSADPLTDPPPPADLHLRGYCLLASPDTWTPPVPLRSAEEAVRYCVLHHAWYKEIRICDDEDYVVLLVADHVLTCPMPDGTLRETRLH
jgi:hypothetical protein